MRSSRAMLFFGLLLSAWTIWPLCAEAQMQSVSPTIAFFYGFELPAELSQAYDRVVVQPAHVKPSSAGGRAEIIAYVSLGEVAGDDRKGIQKSWILGTNPTWNSAVVDVRNEGFQKHFIESRILPLAREGYAGVFLDTLDSPLMHLTSESERAQYRKAMARIIREIRRRAPKLSVIVNRGFEVLDDIASQVDAVAAESLFATWDGTRQQYRETTASDQEWLLQKLRHAQTDLGLQVIAIDYVDPQNAEQADRVRRRIAGEGFTPWVADWQLETPGFGAVDLIPRRVMILRDGVTDFGDEDRAFRHLSVVLEQMGFVPVFGDLSAKSLPALDGLYCGLIVWAAGGREIPAAAKALIREQVGAAMPVLLLGDVPALSSQESSELLRVHSEGAFLKPPLVLRSRSEELGFEVEPIPPAIPIQDFRAHPKDDVWLSVRGRNGSRADVVALTKWGGYALSSYFLRDIGLGEQRWVLDPFAFIRGALRLPSIPVPSLSTEDGGRILVTEIYADRGKPVSSELKKAISGLGFRQELIVASAAGAAGAGSKRQTKLFYPASQTPLRAGRTDVTLTTSSLTHVAAAGRMTADGVEAYFPMASSTGYGVDSAPYAYRRLIETFELTAEPCRISALGIRFEAELASSPGGLRALEAIYSWVSKHDVRPERSQEYAERVRDFYELAMVRTLEGRLQMRGAQRLRSYRLPSALGRFLPKESSKLKSLAESPEGEYVSFVRAQNVALTFDQTKPQAKPKAKPSAEPALVEPSHSLTEAASCR